MAKITVQGNPINTIGDLPKVGAKAPDFKLVNKDLKDVTLADFKGKKKILDIVVALDTSICEISAKRFDKEVGARPDTVVLVISADLPATQARICRDAPNVVTLSMMRDKNFAKDYGVLITDGPIAGLTARSVVVMDENDKVVYTEQVPEIAQEPNYAKALAALK